MTKLTNVGLAQMAAEPADDDRLYIVDDVTGTPTSKYIEYSDLAVNLAKLDEANQFDGDITLTSGSDIYKSINTTYQIISGGSSATTGANIALYGGAEATYPDSIWVRAGSTTTMWIDGTTLNVGIGDTTPGAQLDVDASDASTIAFIANAYAASSTYCASFRYNGAQRIGFDLRSAYSTLEISSADLGSNIAGPNLYIGYNNNAGTKTTGHIRILDETGATWSMWFEKTNGDLRRHSTQPTGDDTIGLVVGTQTSLRSTKNIIGDAMSPADALAIIANTPVYEFTYKSDIRAEPQTYYGITTDDSPLFGWDEGKAFNPVNANGITIQAIKALNARVAELESQLQGA